MKYVRVRWIHDLDEEPIYLFSELDEQRWEMRKVEVFRDGRCGYASAVECSGGSGLALVQIPELSEIAADPQFEPIEISSEEFEAIWARAIAGREVRTLKLMADYGCHPLWIVGTPGDVDPRSLPITSQLSQDLDAWAARLDATYDPADPREAGTFRSTDELRAFVEDGRALARRLEYELRGSFVIDYVKWSP